MDGLNEHRRARVAEILADFTHLQFLIADVPAEPLVPEDANTEGWRALRQCTIDGQHILNTGADTQVPVTKGGHEEQNKAELQQVHLDAFARRHQARKIYHRQQVAQQWISFRAGILQGEQPNAGHVAQLRALDENLWQELEQISDELIYSQLQQADLEMRRWTDEDPPLRSVQRWIRTRR